VKQADGRHALADGGVDQREAIRVKRSLVEDAGAEPVTGGDAARPLVVGLRVAESQAEERSVGDLPEIEAADREGEQPDSGEREGAHGVWKERSQPLRPLPVTSSRTGISTT
jgi:hypothetical protein